MWVYTDNDKRVLGTNENDMSGNTGWEHTNCALPESLFDARGIPMYKISGGKINPRTQAEMDADYVPPEETPTTEQRVNALETTTDDIILMMAELIGG